MNIPELVNNYHLAKTALFSCDREPSRYERQVWAVNGYVREHIEWVGREIILLVELQQALQWEIV